AAVVRGYELFAELFGEMVRHALGETARVHHDERRAVRFDELDETVVDLLPDFRRHDGFQRGAGHFHGEIDAALVTAIHDRSRRGSARFLWMSAESAFSGET